MILEIEYEDLKKHLPRLKEDLKKEVFEELAQEKFIHYPKGLQNFLFGEATPATYKKVNRIWNKKDFPRSIKDNLKGVYLSDLRAYIPPKSNS